MVARMKRLGLMTIAILVGGGLLSCSGSSKEFDLSTAITVDLGRIDLPGVRRVSFTPVLVLHPEVERVFRHQDVFKRRRAELRSVALKFASEKPPAFFDQVDAADILAVEIRDTFNVELGETKKGLLFVDRVVLVGFERTTP